jgi:hypothetical protein
MVGPFGEGDLVKEVTRCVGIGIFVDFWMLGIKCKICGRQSGHGGQRFFLGEVFLKPHFFEARDDVRDVGFRKTDMFLAWGL